MFSRWAIFGVIVGIGTCSNHAIAQDAHSPSFQPTACDLREITPDVAPRLQCGTVAVPRERGSQVDGVFRLAVVIIKTAADRKQVDPVVYIAGGPGAPLTSRAGLIARHEAEIVAPDRDLILVDQRGAGRSEPALCPALSRQQLAIFAAGSEQQNLVRDWRETYGDCRKEMATDGLRPEWFGTQITAADFEDVRQALGIDRWNVYALSYGTAVALTMMALHPEGLRAVVIDSVFPPEPFPMTLSQSFRRALDELFTACARDAVCATVHPNLKETYQTAVQGLDAHALSVPLQPGLGRETFQLRGETFRLLVNVALYSRRGMAILPSFIENARNRRPMALEGVVSSIAHSYRGMSEGIMAAVECRDRTSWQNAEPSDGGDPPVSSFVAGMCQDWSLPGPPPLIAHNTEIPTLLLAGKVDPITPPVFAQTAATALGKRATVIEFANVGHAVQQATPCGEAVVSAFLRNPSNAVDATCAAHIPQVTFK